MLIWFIRQLIMTWIYPLKTCSLLMGAIQLAAAQPLRAQETLESIILSGNYAKAETTLAGLIAQPEAKFRSEAILTLADLYAIQGDSEKAFRVLEILDPVPAQHALRAKTLRGRIALAEQKWKEAERRFAQIVDAPPSAETAIRGAGFLGLADAYTGMGDFGKATRVLRAFVDQTPDAPLGQTSAALNRLKALGAFSGSQADEDLVTWSSSSAPYLKSLATFHLAQAAISAGDMTTAREHLTALDTLNLVNNLGPAEQLELASLYLELEEPGRATTVITGIPEDQINAQDKASLAAWASFSRGDYATASKSFRKAADLAREDETIASILNMDAGLAAIMGNDTDAIEEVTQFFTTIEDQAAASAFALERGLLEAARNQPQAVETLLALIKNYPGHPRLADAHIALAEILFLGIPAQPIAAREHIAAAREQPVSPAQAERIDYVAIWIESSAGAKDELITLSREFIEKWPESSRVPSVRFKLGEVYFKNSSYRNALRHFLTVADQYSDSPYADAALFYAAKSAWLTGLPHRADEAIALWGRLVDGDSPYKMTAWAEQGLTKMALGKEAEAVAVFDSILANDPPPKGELLFSVLTSKGQSEFNLAAKQASFLETAIKSFSSVVDDPNAPTFWRNQAAVRMAKCLEQQGNTEEALDVYARVIQAGPIPTIDEPPEFDWYFRAGFSAIRLLESQEDWRSAVSVAERLSRAGGNRTQEATEIANKLRLEHFIWENAPGSSPDAPPSP